MSSFFSMSPNQLALLASVLGVAIAENLNPNEQNSFGNFIQSLGQSILTISAQEELLQNKLDTMEQIESLKHQICKLEQEIRKKRF